MDEFQNNWTRRKKIYKWIIIVVGICLIFTFVVETWYLIWGQRFLNNIYLKGRDDVIQQIYQTAQEQGQIIIQDLKLIKQ
ncbi:MAG: hypothetical protein PHT54_03500 [Candidatus Nanoarchaeia archaeon]|nr:hypothetical protein [Candidatus Nanoarchaeia archaeon]